MAAIHLIENGPSYSEQDTCGLAACQSDTSPSLPLPFFLAMHAGYCGENNGLSFSISINDAISEWQTPMLTVIAPRKAHPDNQLE